MATPNYSFEKRKRELAKKAAKEAKRQRKAERAATAATVVPAPEGAAEESGTPPEGPVSEN